MAHPPSTQQSLTTVVATTGPARHARYVFTTLGLVIHCVYFSFVLFLSLQDSVGYCAQDTATVLVGLSVWPLFAGVSLFTVFIVTTPLPVHRFT